MDTHIVLTALWDYRETLTIVNDTAPRPHIQDRIACVDRLIASFRRSYLALNRLEIY